MPFGKYKNFEDCVRKNKDKRSPEGYCAVIMRKVEGDRMFKKSKRKVSVRKHRRRPTVRRDGVRVKGSVVDRHKRNIAKLEKKIETEKRVTQLSKLKSEAGLKRAGVDLERAKVEEEISKSAKLRAEALAAIERRRSLNKTKLPRIDLISPRESKALSNLIKQERVKSLKSGKTNSNKNNPEGWTFSDERDYQAYLRDAERSHANALMSKELKKGDPFYGVFT